MDSLHRVPRHGKETPYWEQDEGIEDKYGEKKRGNNTTELGLEKSRNFA